MISKGIRPALHRYDVAHGSALQTTLHQVVNVQPEPERGAE
jgi:hypothetical protein